MAVADIGNSIAIGGRIGNIIISGISYIIAYSGESGIRKRMTTIIGTSDEITTCDCCGKSNLKLTVMLNRDGQIVHYGRDCAAKSFRTIRSGSWSHEATAKAIVANAKAYRAGQAALVLI